MSSLRAYSFCVTQRPFEGIVAMPRRQQRELVATFEALAQKPFTEGLLDTVDSDGRTHRVVAEAGCLIYFWSDHAIREVRITALVPV